MVIITWSQVLIWPFSIVCLTFGTSSACTTTVFVNHLTDIYITIVTRIHCHIISNIFTHCSPFGPFLCFLARLQAALPVLWIFHFAGSWTLLCELESLDSESPSSPSAPSVWLATLASLPSCLRSAAVAWWDVHCLTCWGGIAVVPLLPAPLVLGRVAVAMVALVFSTALLLPCSRVVWPSCPGWCCSSRSQTANRLFSSCNTLYCNTFCWYATSHSNRSLSCWDSSMSLSNSASSRSGGTCADTMISPPFSVLPMFGFTYGWNKLLSTSSPSSTSCSWLPST